MKGVIFILRVIAGLAKGHKLTTLKGDITRPTMDKVKGAIFNMIAPKIPDAKVLDLFAGSGSLGIEALSRGAKIAVFVDRNKQSVNVIKKNLDYTKLADSAIIINEEVERIYNILPKDLTKFDIIFMDPPYNKILYKKP